MNTLLFAQSLIASQVISLIVRSDRRRASCSSTTSSGITLTGINDAARTTVGAATSANKPPRNPRRDDSITE